MSDTVFVMSDTNSVDKRSAVPLNAIRAFVEAARQLSFSRAAQLLGMTQSGVSHHVVSLEKHLGKRLFIRSGSSVALTDTGRQYFDTIHEAFSTIEWSTRQLAQRSDNGRLIVRTSLPTFAMNAVIPVLPDFSPELPMPVDLVTSLSPPAATDDFDVLLTRDLELNDETHWLLAHEVLVCVAAPALHASMSGRGVVGCPFISARSRPDTMIEWVNAQGFDASSIQVCASFEHYFLALSAAIGGMGYLVVPKILVAESLRQGHLVDVGLAAIKSRFSYTAWVNPRSSRPDAARAFCRWLVKVFRAEGDA